MALSLSELLGEMMAKRASDLYLTVGYPPALRIGNRMETLGQYALDAADTENLLEQAVDHDKLTDFFNTHELNAALRGENNSRFRLNAFRQQELTGIVIRRVRSDIPTPAKIGLPPIYAQLMLERRGLIFVAGPTGSGKTTSAAAMIGYRNTESTGHIITIEDPIEFVHHHQGCIITQRDVGIDTESYGTALKNALRQRPDVLFIGEIRDSDTMEHAINFAETGHLVLATLHANNAGQTLERIVSFFPQEKRHQLLMGLALNLRAILTQRLVTDKSGIPLPAIEVMLNKGHVRNLIEEGKVKELKDIIEKGQEQGMQTFEQHLFLLYSQGRITEEMAIAEADNPANMRLMIRQKATSQEFRSLENASRNTTGF